MDADSRNALVVNGNPSNPPHPTNFSVMKVEDMSADNTHEPQATVLINHNHENHHEHNASSSCSTCSSSDESEGDTHAGKAHGHKRSLKRDANAMRDITPPLGSDTVKNAPSITHPAIKGATFDGGSGSEYEASSSSSEEDESSSSGEDGEGEDHNDETARSDPGNVPNDNDAASNSGDILAHKYHVKVHDQVLQQFGGECTINADEISKLKQLGWLITGDMTYGTTGYEIVVCARRDSGMYLGETPADEPNFIEEPVVVDCGTPAFTKTGKFVGRICEVVGFANDPEKPPHHLITFRDKEHFTNLDVSFGEMLYFQDSQDTIIDVLSLQNVHRKNVDDQESGSDVESDIEGHAGENGEKKKKSKPGKRAEMTGVDGGRAERGHGNSLVDGGRGGRDGAGNRARRGRRRQPRANLPNDGRGAHHDHPPRNPYDPRSTTHNPYDASIPEQRGRHSTRGNRGRSRGDYASRNQPFQSSPHQFMGGAFPQGQPFSPAGTHSPMLPMPPGPNPFPFSFAPSMSATGYPPQFSPHLYPSSVPNAHWQQSNGQQAFGAQNQRGNWHRTPNNATQPAQQTSLPQGPPNFSFSNGAAPSYNDYHQQWGGHGHR